MTSPKHSGSRTPRARLLFRACLGLSMVVAACEGAGRGPSDGESTGSNDEATPAAPAPSESAPSRDAAPAPSTSSTTEAAAPTADAAPAQPPPDLYDPATIPHFELTFEAAALAVLSSTDEADRETWVHGKLTYGDLTFDDVGVRRKGNHSYRALPRKAALKIKLNKWVSGQKLHGLNELTLNNMVDSPTYLAERLTFHIFRALQMPAMKANTAHLTINGEDYGIYANVETPNRAFLTRTFGAAANTLYEAHTGSDEWVPGCEGRMDIDVADPRAPAGERPDLTSLFRAVAAASDATLPGAVAAHLDTRQWLRYAAIDGLVGQSDGYAFSLNGSHNYYLAGDTSGVFRVLPWSADSTLSDVMTVVDLSAPAPGTLLTRCARSVACWADFRGETRDVLATYETLGLVDLAKQWHDQIDALVRSDPKREKSVEYYEARTAQLYDWLASRPRIVRAQLGL